ncbi:hypothetical protein A8B82_12235 [Sulfitobacter sp. EhC04]|uniref:hypothetical protein n=1 Tax=Sulfitobacter sp. EhC04 TaxID=1849168 RepID=UPI0007F51BE5|nr:hypothetical protein [Sulfitobacter sp. EhC04]OAN77674.1 hypothetical protein A8B82_12235 [Sulfitobacter sp. EhC04]
MGRLFLLALVAGVIIAIVVILASIWSNAVDQGRRALRPIFGPTKDGVMAPNGLQKVAYVALIALLLGTASGLLGGL